MKGGTNAGTLLITCLAVSLILLSAMYFYNGVANSYGLTVTAGENITSFQMGSGLNTSLSNYSSGLANSTEGGIGGAVTHDTESGNVLVNGFFIAGGALLTTIKEMAAIVPMLTMILGSVAAALKLPSYVVAGVTVAITLTVTLIMVNAILKWNVKDDTR